MNQLLLFYNHMICLQKPIETHPKPGRNQAKPGTHSSMQMHYSYNETYDEIENLNRKHKNTKPGKTNRNQAPNQAPNHQTLRTVRIREHEVGRPLLVL